MAKILKPIRLPIDKFPFTTSMLPIPIVKIEDIKIKKLVVDICWASFLAMDESTASFFSRKLSI